MRTLIFLCLSFAFNLSVSAQYIWLDEAGRKVFSDQPPPVNLPNKRILKQPNQPKANPSSKDTGEVSKGETSSENSQSNDKTNALTTGDFLKANKKANKQDKELEEAKKKIDVDAAEKKKNELEATNKIKADNCVRAKQAKSTLDSGMRLSHTNAKGERGFMDEATRMVESKRLEGIMSSDCK